MYDGGKFGPPTIQKSVKFRDFVEKYVRSLFKFNVFTFKLGKFPNLSRSFQQYQWFNSLTGLY